MEAYNAEQSQEKRVIYVTIGSTWLADSPRYAAVFTNSSWSSTAHWVDLEKVTGNTYKCEIPNGRL